MAAARLMRDFLVVRARSSAPVPPSPILFQRFLYAPDVRTFLRAGTLRVRIKRNDPAVKPHPRVYPGLHNTAARFQRYYPFTGPFYSKLYSQKASPLSALS